MRDLLLTEDGDLKINTDLFLTNEYQYIEQTTKVVLLTKKGEWARNENVGLDILQFMGNPLNKVVKELIDDEIIESIATITNAFVYIDSSSLDNSMYNTSITVQSDNAYYDYPSVLNYNITNGIVRYTAINNEKEDDLYKVKHTNETNPYLLRNK